MIRAVLIGNPVDKSISHITHNEIFKKCNLNAIYEKRAICIERLCEEVADLKKEDYAYLAVTMPLKELIIPFLDETCEAIGSVNTIEVRDGKWIGHNFDGIAALNVIEKRESVKDRRVLVLGAGGAAKAAIYEAKKRGAEVFVYNRTYERAERVCRQFNVEALTNIASKFDIIIQATSIGMFSRELPMDIKWIDQSTLVLEMVYNPKKTAFIEESLKKGARIIYGYEMFSELTFAQFSLVFGDKISRDVTLQVVKNFFN